MASVIVFLCAAAVLAFGAVYPWGYIPLFASATLIGAVGLIKGRSRLRYVWPLGLGLSTVAAVIAVQLVPVSNHVLLAVSPRTVDLLRDYSVSFRADPAAHALSIEPRATDIALFAVFALGALVLGLPALLTGAAIRSIPLGLMIFAVPLSILGIVSARWSNGLVYWFWKPHEGGGSNAFGPFVNRNHFAGWMLMAICVSLGYWLGQLERAQRSRNSRRSFSSSALNALALTSAATVTMTIALIWTLSRSAIIGLAGAVFCFAALIAMRRTVNKRGRILGVSALLSVLLVGLSWRGLGHVASWYADTRDLESRFAAWRDGWQVVRDFPLVGTGLNTYGVAMLFYQKSNAGFHLGSAHNDYLQILAEGGLLIAIPAAIAIIALAAAIRRNLVASSHESRGYWIRAGAAVGLLAIGVQEIAEFSLQIPANAFLFCTLAAIALAPIEHHLPKGPVAMRSTR